MAKDISKIDGRKVAFFRFKKFSGGKKKYLLTNDVGDFVFLGEKDFHQYLRGRLPEKNPSLKELKEKGFLRDYQDFPSLMERYRRRIAPVFGGPGLHIIVTTLRCNHKCLYCHASSVSSECSGYDMSLRTAKKAVDLVFKTPSKSAAIEFQGGEPTLNWPAIKFITEYARKKNQNEGKMLDIRLITNLSEMNEARLDFLLKNKVGICTSLDGPEFLHNKNRIYLGGSSYKNAVYWLKKARSQYQKRAPKMLPAALMTTTRHSLPFGKEIVNEYLALKMNSVYLRPLNPFGFAKQTWEQIGYSADEYVKFYLKTLDYLISLNLRGKKVKEVLASMFLVKIFTDSDPGHLDYRSPCGAGIGQMAYNYDGNIYTCDEGRMFGRMGDDAFKIGTVRDKFEDLMNSSAVKSMCVASCTDSLPGCSDCVYKPYCGVCPIYNYSTGGNIFGQMPSNDRCKILKATFDYLFERIENKKIRPVFENWLGYYKDGSKLNRETRTSC